MDDTYSYQIVRKYSHCNYNDCIVYGTKEDCWADVSKGAKRIAFGKASDNNIQSAILKPDLNKLYNCKSLDFLPESISFLQVPLPLLKYVQKSTLPNLKQLLVSNKHSYTKDKVLFKDCSLDTSLNLASICFFGDSGKSSEYWSLFNIDVSEFRKLEYFSGKMDKQGRVLDKIVKLSHLPYLGVSCAYQEDLLNLVGHLGTKMLSLSSCYKNVNLGEFQNYDDLEVFSVYEYKSDFDCSVLLSLPNLKEIDFTGINKIHNAEILLEIKSLQSVSIINCRNPLKKEGREKFIKHGFKYLDVALS